MAPLQIYYPHRFSSWRSAVHGRLERLPLMYSGNSYLYTHSDLCTSFPCLTSFLPMTYFFFPSLQLDYFHLWRPNSNLSPSSPALARSHLSSSQMSREFWLYTTYSTNIWNAYMMWAHLLKLQKAALKPLIKWFNKTVHNDHWSQMCISYQNIILKSI